MLRTFRLNPTATMLCVALALPAPGMAADPPNILVLGAASGGDVLSGDRRILDSVLDNLSENLLEAGYAVYSETALDGKGAHSTLDGLSEGALLDLARQVRRPPLDLAIMISVRAKVREHTYTTKIVSHIDARLMDVATGRRLGSFGVVSPRALRAPIDCDRTCVQAAVARGTGRLSDELAAQLAARLASVAEAPAVDGSRLASAFSLVFDGFSTEEINELEEYLVVFSGYRRHRPVRTAEGRHEYWYESQSSRGRLSRNLRKVLGHLDLQGRVHLAGNVFTVERLGLLDPAANDWRDW